MTVLTDEHKEGGWSSFSGALFVSATFLIFTSLTLQLTSSDHIQSLTVHDLMTKKFPHLTSDDLNMYPCKADIFEGDIIMKKPHIRSYRGELFDEQDRRRRRKKKRRKFQTEQNFTMNHGRTKHSKRRSEAMRQTRHGKRRSGRAATARKERLWKHGIIPYQIEGNFSGEHRALFKQAMRYWENYTCIQFVEKTPDHTNYIFFTQRSCGCCSFVGKRGNGGQAISIGKNCDKFGIVVHELGHVIGFWHEHTRPDRDHHVQIITRNILAGQEYNFNKLMEEEVNSLGLSYDYDSIMHYARNTFSKNAALDTILPKGGFLFLRPVIGQRIKLSDGDIAQTNKLYKCPKCGRTCQEASGHMKSPGFELSQKSTNEGAFCEWRITGTHGERIALNITALNIFSTPHCDTDYIEVRDGYWFKSSLLGRFCGSSPVEERLFSSEHRMLITYKASPGHSIYKGFEAKYDAICGGSIERNEGILQSPNYPDLYRANKECLWTIAVTRGTQVALTFQAFEVEIHDNCAYDYVEIRDGLDLLSPLLGTRLCGHKLPGIIRSSSNKMLVRFVSDSSVQKIGFSASFVKEKDECQSPDHGCQQICVNTVGSYRCECDIGYELHSDGKKCEDACGGVFSSPSGIITSPSFPDLYPSNKHCSWEIVAPEKFTITLNFTHFDLEGANQNCEYDSIEIRSLVENEDETKYGVFCGSHLPPVVTSKRRSIKIEFFSDNSVQKSGFAAVYSTDKDECASENGGCQHICKNIVGSYKCSCHNGFILHENKHDCKEGSCVYHLTGSRGEVSSPNYPENYSSRRDCTWTFTTTPGHRIKLVFEDFEIESQQECAYDYVAFYDGKSINAPLLGRFCGSKFPHPILSTSSDMLMTFRTDLSVQKKGFKAVYTTACGGRLTVSSAVAHLISHVKFGDQNYENNADCNWFITSVNAKRIRIHFRTLELEEEKDCGYDFVEIFEGFETGPKLGKFCGNKLPPDITTSESMAVIQFQSDDTINHKGFSITFTEV